MPAKSHGMTAGKHNARHYPSIYGVWKNMKQRCTNPNNPRYVDYGGRGITVCKRWLSFENFYADMGDRPKGMSLDRRNNDRGYSPSNCQWASTSAQNINSRRAKPTRIGNETMCISDWCRKTGITYGLYKARVRKGWSLEKALTTPPRKQVNNRTKEKL